MLCCCVLKTPSVTENVFLLFYLFVTEANIYSVYHVHQAKTNAVFVCFNSQLFSL